MCFCSSNETRRKQEAVTHPSAVQLLLHAPHAFVGFQVVDIGTHGRFCLSKPTILGCSPQNKLTNYEQLQTTRHFYSYSSMSQSCFPPSLSDASLDSWKLNGVVTLRDLCVNRQTASFTPLKTSSLFLQHTSFDIYRLGIMSVSVYLTNLSLR